MEGLHALRHGAAWHDLSARGRLSATGEDRARLIHAIASNAVEGLPAGRGVYSFFLNPQGRIQADCHIFVDRDRLLIDCEPEAATSLREHIDGYIIMDDVTLRDARPGTATLAVAGPAAGDAVTRLSERLPAEPLAFLESGGLTIYRAPLAGAAGYWIDAPAGERDRIVAALEAGGAAAASHAACEAHRVRNGVPRFGADFGPANIPHETQQLHAVSFSKGCYTGQEIVERVRSQGKVRQLLVAVDLGSGAVPADLTVRHEERPVGTLTSATPGPPDGGPGACGFAIVRRAAAAPGTAVRVGDVPGTVRDVARG